MKHKRLLLLALCAFFLFSLLACEISGNVVITVVVPTHVPPTCCPATSADPVDPPEPPPTEPPAP